MYIYLLGSTFQESNIDNITRGCEICISAMFLQSDLNKWWLTLLEKLDKLYINSGSTRLLQRSKIDYIEYNNQIFPSNSHKYLRAFDYLSSYHFPYPIAGSKIPK